jgi:voltage-gated potassium channel Kch
MRRTGKVAGSLAGLRVIGHHPTRTRRRNPRRREHGGVKRPIYELSARRAVWIIAAATLAIGIAGGLLITVLDPDDFNDVGLGLWWSMQTITTVGYGDTVPTSTEGRILGVFVMVTGIALTAVVTAAITAVFIESARSKRGGSERALMKQLDERLARIERLLSVDQRLEGDQREPDGRGEHGMPER